MAVVAGIGAAGGRQVAVAPSALPVLPVNRDGAPSRQAVVNRALRGVVAKVPVSEMHRAYTEAQALSGLTAKGLLFGVAAYVQAEARPPGGGLPERGRYLDVKL